ncbi:methylmalonyl-CoA mutase [Sinorhizobium medicae]|uniref:cobalamin B12-binding domain-containing protein n=1 Tax=Sinorhizobium medicae TaxID=110321 RepID=UPI001296DCE0|nr:cobalamin B12-binding domain-containing protein [Sinorhizobium medicae]MDX0499629.1 methylmalonyl-CoA mutase [Sinorhizobium medicae]MDX0649846.1 methylmalonyl-CoA mutase [Sinorhizobium medicae]MDX0994850.1 methylmalonyl-CoA mutase [Sinorhizobium medicae]MDX1050884.1 methylmalonyl-CoA mutase [Sinorhizobium medicae]MDX1178710.1 methylmalonyl-CoA mutase [Sinorhizobium medicae]
MADTKGAGAVIEANEASHTNATIRVLVAKLGLDGHDRGAKVVAPILRDAGMEVVYTGLYKSPKDVVQAAIQEDVDVIGVSLLSGSHVPLFRELCRCLREEGAEHVLVVAGGVIPEQDYPALLECGVDAIVPQEARAGLIVTAITDLVAARGRI